MYVCKDVCELGPWRKVIIEINETLHYVLVSLCRRHIRVGIITVVGAKQSFYDIFLANKKNVLTLPTHAHSVLSLNN